MRSGLAYFPSFLKPRRRCEQALVAVGLEAYVDGDRTLGAPGLLCERPEAM